MVEFCFDEQQQVFALKPLRVFLLLTWDKEFCQDLGSWNQPLQRPKQRRPTGLKETHMRALKT